MGPLTDKQFWGDIANNTRQAAGGLLSATLGAPVDIATMLMRPFGYKVDDKKVVGSSEHIAGLLGLDSESIPYKVASLMPTDATDLMKYGGLLGTFAGVNAKTANKALLEAAQKMDKSGVDRATIWQDTGWFKGPEGKWRFEIDDSNSMPGQKLYSWGEAEDLKRGNSTVVRRQKALLHPELSAAYPDTKNVGVHLRPGQADGGSYNADFDNISVGVAPNGAANRSTMLHELQHAIQKREGFAVGGSPTSIGGHRDPVWETYINRQLQPYLTKDEQLLTRLNEMKDQLAAARPKIESDPAYALAKTQEQQQMIVNKYLPGFNLDEWYGMRKERANLVDSVKRIKERAQFGPDQQQKLELYRSLAGEAEARAVEARMNMNAAQRRAKAPWESYDVPWEQLIVR